MENEQRGSTFQRSVQSGKWLLVGSVLQKVISIAPFFVLSRLLAPNDYGVITVVFTVTSFLDRIAAPGFADALVHRQKSFEPYLDTMWTYGLFKAVFIGIGIYFTSHFIVAFFHVSTSYTLLIQLSGLLPVISSFSNIRQIYFSKNLDFKKIFIRSLVGSVVYGLVAIVWALILSATAWALFVGYIARYAAEVVATYILYPSKPRLAFHFGRLKDLIGFGKWVYWHDFLDYVTSFVDTTLIGRMLGVTQLGLYSRARDFPTTVSLPILSVFDKISFPAYAEVQNRLDKIQIGFLRSVDIFLFVSVPFSLLLLIEGGALIEVLLGANWMSIVVPLKIMSINAIFVGLCSLVKPIFKAVGKPSINVVIDLWQLVIMGFFIFFGIRWSGLFGASVGITLGSGLLLGISIMKVRPYLRLGRDKFLSSLASVGLASAMTLGLAIIARGFVHKHFENGVILLWTGFLGLWYFIVICYMSYKLKSGLWVTLMSVWFELRKRPLLH